MLKNVSPILVTGLVLAWVSGFNPSQGEGAVPKSDCDRERLGTVLVLDTTSLIRTQLNGPSSQSTEGRLVVVWSDSTGPRVIHASYFGEIGRAESKYYILAPQNVVVESENVLYEKPLSVEPNPRIRSRVPAVTYICDGQADQRGDSVIAARAETELKSLLADEAVR